MANDKSDMAYIGGLWLNESKAGEKYFSGSFGIGARILIFKNKNKESDNHPDYNMYIVPNEKREETNQDIPDEDDVPF